ncbi:MAG: hypothetical protein ABI855_17305 [Bacteroidota bacterium]
MKTTSINTVIEKFNSLLFEEKEFAVEIIKKAYAEAAREAILKRAAKATQNFKKGKGKKGGVKDLYKDLEDD